MLTKEDFKDLPVGIEITIDDKLYKFNHIVNDLVFFINPSKTCSAFSVQYINDNNAILNFKQYYKGWEVRSYEGENVWVIVDKMNSARQLLEVKKDCIIIEWCGETYTHDDFEQLITNQTVLCKQ